DAVERRERAAEHVVEPAELVRALDRDEVGRPLHDAHDRAVTPRVAAVLGGFVLRHVPARLAEADAVLGLLEREPARARLGRPPALLALLDRFAVRASPPTYRAASLVLVIEGAAVLAMLVVVVKGTRLTPDVIWLHVTPPAIALLALWLASLWLVGRARTGLPWHEAGNPPDGQKEPRGMAHARKDEAMTRRGRSTARVVSVFSVAALITLGAGIVLE